MGWILRYDLVKNCFFFQPSLLKDNLDGFLIWKHYVVRIFGRILLEQANVHNQVHITEISCFKLFFVELFIKQLCVRNAVKQEIIAYTLNKVTILLTHNAPCLSHS